MTDFVVDFAIGGLIVSGVRVGFSVAACFAEDLLAIGLAFAAFLTVFLAGALPAALTLPRRADFAPAARFVAALLFALAFDFALVLRLAEAAFAAFFRPPLRAFLAGAGEAFAFERALERVLDRDAVALLDLLDLLLAMMVAAGKGFRRASQSEVMI